MTVFEMCLFCFILGLFVMYLVIFYEVAVQGESLQFLDWKEFVGAVVIILVGAILFPAVIIFKLREKKAQ